MITTNAFVDGILKFASMDVLPKMPNGMSKFLGYMALGAVQRNPMSVLTPYMDLMKMVGIMHDDMIDTDLLKTALECGFKQQSSVTIAGFRFTADDIPSLMKYFA